MNETLRRELLVMAAEDQRIRHLVDEHDGPRDEIPDELAREWARVDRANTARLAQIVTESGWPTRATVGDDGAHAAWLLAQQPSACARWPTTSPRHSSARAGDTDPRVRLV